jgi:ATP-dependent RNA helicase DDX54/DBP10
MKRRAASPTPSEGEIDIAGALFDDLDDPPETTQGAPDFDFGNLLRNGDDDDDDEDDDGDAEFIASRQRISNRKSSNLQGKTVKKGGGFQAMGALRCSARDRDKIADPISRPQC